MEIVDLAVYSVTFATFAIFLVQCFYGVKGYKVSRMLNDYHLLSSGRHVYSKIMYDVYLQAARGMKGREPLKPGRNLLLTDKWVAQSDTEKKLVLRVSGDPCDKTPRRISWQKLNHGWPSMFILPRFTKAGYSGNIRQYAGKRMFNGDGFRLRSIELKDDELIMSVSPCRYFDYQDTCEYIAYNSARYINSKSLFSGVFNGSVSSSEEYKKYRYLKELFDYDNRCMMVGACALTVIHNVGVEKRKYFMIHRRSDDVAEAINAISLVPSGALSGPFTHEMDKGVSEMIRDTVTREFDEEVLGMDELEIASDYTPRAVWGDVNMRFLGAGMDPLTTKMETIVRMDIDLERSSPFPVTEDGSEIKDLETLKEHIAGCKEGEISFVEYTMDNIQRHMNNENAMPVFREAMRITYLEERRNQGSGS